MIALDTETALATAEEPVPRLVSAAFATDTGSCLFVAHDPRLPSALRMALQTEVVLANAVFDLGAIARAYPQLRGDVIDALEHGRVFDVLTAERLFSIMVGTGAQRVGLAVVAEKRLGQQIDKSADTWRMHYALLLGQDEHTWPDAAREYAIKDAEITWQIYRSQIAEEKSLAVDVLFPMADLVRRAWALHQQSLLGVAVDADAVTRLDRRLCAEIDALQRACVANGLIRWVGKKAPKLVRSTKLAKAMMADLAGQGVMVSRTPTGAVSLSEDALKVAQIPRGSFVTDGDRLMFNGHPMDAFRRLGSRQSQRTKTIPPRMFPIIRTQYDDLKVTGRTGSGGFSPKGMYSFWSASSDNLQNQNKEEGFRETLRARPGCTLVVSDWGAIELVTGAQIQLDWFQRSRLADVLREGRNPHDEMACTILGIDRHRFDKKTPAHAKARQLAKAPNFGFPGLLGAKRFVEYAAKEPYNIALTEVEAKQLKTHWSETWPEWALYQRAICDGRAPGCLLGNQGLITIVGPRFGIVRGACYPAEACNFPFQGLAAAAAGTALWRLWRAGEDPSSPMFGCRQVLFVHDENVTECPIDRAEEVRAEQERIMIESVRQWCPDVPIKVESVISENYTK